MAQSATDAGHGEKTIRDFSEEQLANLTAIVWLYREEKNRYLGLVERYLEQVHGGLDDLRAKVEAIDVPLAELTDRLDAFNNGDLEESQGKEAFDELLTERAEAIASFEADREALLQDLDNWKAGPDAGAKTNNAEQRALGESFEPFVARLTALRKHVGEAQKLTVRAVDHARKELAATRSSHWVNKEVRKQSEALDEARQAALEAVHAIHHPFAQVTWLQSRFPEARIADVPGLCKVVTTEEIAAQDHSLTPGRYVGVAPPEPEDEEHVEARLREIHVELASLNEEAMDLGALISANFEALVG